MHSRFLPFPSAVLSFQLPVSSCADACLAIAPFLVRWINAEPFALSAPDGNFYIEFYGALDKHGARRIHFFVPENHSGSVENANEARRSRSAKQPVTSAPQTTSRAKRRCVVGKTMRGAPLNVPVMMVNCTINPPAPCLWQAPASRQRPEPPPMENQAGHSPERRAVDDQGPRELLRDGALRYHLICKYVPNYYKEH